MKIAYIVDWDVDKESGVLKKILDQVSSWQGKKHLARLFFLSNQINSCRALKDFSFSVFEKKKGFKRLIQLKTLVREVIEWAPDIIYLRFNRYYPAYEGILKRYPVVLEINSNDLSEAGIFLKNIKFFYHKITRERLLRKASGFVFVSGEIAQNYLHYKKPFLVLGNSIRLSDFTVRLPVSREFPRLVFLGEPHVWDGMDKILFMAEKFPLWKFDIVGYEEKDLPWVRPANVCCHGFLPREDYEELMAESDVGIGTLALERKNMSETSALKILEYLAYGLPVVVGYKETNFQNKEPYVLELPSSEDNLKNNVDRIKEFVGFWHGKRVPRDEIKFIDVEKIEEKRISFFEKCLTGNQ